MTTQIPVFTDLTDSELLAEVRALATRERAAIVRLIASLVEIDRRRLYLGEGCSSLFTFCTQVLRLSEHAAYGRIEAARAARRCPVVLERLAEGSVTLTTINLLTAHLERVRTAATSSPRPAPAPARRTRHIPASVRRAVWKRDAGRCAFVGTNGRCSETGFLELHHVDPFAMGGASTVENLELRCAAHNRHEARLYFGSDVVRERPDHESWYVNSVWT